jgi:putative NIF3 family GTP cyclohydrolase 1 type 2
MKLGDLYRKAIATGIENDPRGKNFVLRDLDRRKKEFNELKPADKEFFDPESLENPYSDSRILVGNENSEVTSILAGIDIDVGEILLADTLRARGKKVDLLLSHHPSGKALANLSSVMEMQSDILNIYGVPINIAEGLIDGRMKEVERKLMPVNHTRAADAARLLDIPFLCLHTPADNMVATFLQRLLDTEKPYLLSDVLDLLRAVPEYKTAGIDSFSPKILIGSRNRKAGKIFVDMTGGTEGAKEIFESLTQSGVNTIVGMHLSEDHRKEAEKNHMNVIIAGHIPSDNIGLNLLLDEITSDKSCDILECSGFRRFSRLASARTE